MAGKKRDRSARRARERGLRKDVRKVEKQAARGPGGSAGRAIEDGSAPLVEIRARATPCPQCGGELELSEVEARSTEHGRRRVALTRCRRCHTPRELWFAIGPTVS